MPAYSTTDTIAAPATVPGRSAIAMLRISGPEAFSMLLRLCSGIAETPEHGRAVLLGLEFAPPQGGELPVLREMGVATCHHAPNSYTGDDLVELCIHGNPLLMERALSSVLAYGARVSEPGEFTYRAFVNGKLDLMQAEAVHDLINAGSSRALQLAQSALGGTTGKQVRQWQQHLLGLLSRIELIHDYASDDLDASVQPEDLLTVVELCRTLEALASELSTAVLDSQRAGLQRHGISMAIVGAPNVGKSTLFNALLGYDRALVHHSPGTTRDYLSESVEFGGLMFNLVDTAGQHGTTDEIEQAGVEMARDWTRSADMLILVNAADETAGDDADHAWETDGRELIQVVTRCDLLPEWPENLEGRFHVSGLDGRGIEQLRTYIIEQCGLGKGSELAGFNQRQTALISRALEHITLAISSLREGMPMDAAAQDLHLARECLLDVNQSSSRHDVVDSIFSSFCVGK